MTSRNKNYILVEGMRVGDLADLLLPLVSIDEFESKIDINAVVVGFYVADEDAADDLNRFIQRSPVEILDTDVSPAPDQNGHYMVFVELLNNDKTASEIIEIIEEISPLCAIEEWDMEIRGMDEIVPLDCEVMKKHIDRNSIYDKDTAHQSGQVDVKEAVRKALHESDAEQTIVVDNVGDTLIFIRSHRDRVDGKILAVGRTLEEVESCIFGFGQRFTSDGLVESRKVERILGPGWDVACFGTKQLWTGPDTCLVVEPTVV